MVRYSSRIPWDTSINALSAALARKRESGVRLLDLTESNPTEAGLVYPENEILRALSNARALLYNPAPLGLPEARTAVSAYYGGKVPPERILLTASTSEAYSYLFKLLCNPGDEVLTPRPSYPLFEFLADLDSVRVVRYPLHYQHGWTLDTGALRQAVTPRTRAIVFVSPNNPTGSFLKRSEYAEVVEICREHSLAIICDEVFADYAFGLDPDRMQTLSAETDVLTFCLSGLSKVSGLPQMKLGWIVAAGPPAVVKDAVYKLELIADTFLSVGAPVQWAAPALLAAGESIQKQIRERAAANLAWLRRRVAPTAFRALEVEAGWYATLRVPRVRTEEEWVLELLNGKDVLTQPGFYYDFESEAFLVLSLLTREADFREGVERICSL